MERLKKLMDVSIQTIVVLVRDIADAFGVFHLQELMLLLFIALEVDGFFAGACKRDALLVLVSRSESLPALLVE